ncbi:MAG TPA: phosphate signaling complex protein PhoU [Anaerolineaceae bacterium]|nr:phosphate signaling complex protein PhoU [Anaerolineaceae bacterium]
MPRETLDRELQHLRDEVLILGSKVEQAMLDSVDALKRRDLAASRRIFYDDQVINEKRFAIENAILVLIATQQPMAHDLRFLAAILEVITELERMGDYAKGIAKVNALLGPNDEIKPMREISQMADTAVEMLHRALGAFVNEDAALARAIPETDSQVDDLYNQVYRSLVKSMIADPTTIDHANYMLWVAHNLERMADRVTNICERTVFIATGEMMEMRASDDEEFETE